MKMLAFVLLVAALHGGLCSEWNYAEHGPKTWGDYCKGKSQSPINIVTCETTKSSKTNRVASHNYWKMPGKQKYTIQNNGHALQIDLPSGTGYELTKGGKRWTPVQIHIHFDPLTGKGSEHLLNSKKYFAEIHIVHRNSNYTTKEKFMNNPDGLLVIGIFVDLVEGSADSDLDFSIHHLGSHQVMPNERTSFAMQVFGFGADHLKKKDDSKSVNPFPLAWLLPKTPRKMSMFEYVNYKGSLTTPPCSEIVDWIVITGRTLEINEKTAKKFESVKNADKEPMAGNNRPIQDLNGRDVFSVEGML